jgi:transposase-like protein
MAKRQEFQLSTEERRRRTFSEEFKQKKVREIEQKITSIAEVSRQYEVRASNVSNWLSKYSSQRMKGIRTIVESESDTRKILDQQQKIAELERIIGQKQLLIDFQSKMMELTEQEYGIDIKKKFEKSPLFGIGNTGSNSTVV